MSGPENTSEPNKRSSRHGVNVPFVFFGAFSASVALMGSSAIAAETSLESARPSVEGFSAQAPKLAINPDGSVEVESAQPKVKPTSQQTSQPLHKQENNDWRVILNEDGTLSVVRADEVPESATEVSCTADGICTPVVEAEEDTTNAGSTTADTEADSEGSTGSPTAEGPVFPGRYDS